MFAITWARAVTGSQREIHVFNNVHGLELSQNEDHLTTCIIGSFVTQYKIIFNL